VKVNGSVVQAPSAKFPTNCSISVNGMVVKVVPLLVAFNKPVGVLSTMGDPSDRRSLVDCVPSNWKAMGLHPVGRLGDDNFCFFHHN
jgi:16S rRNA U516 pseudouridylate synthase RsuA-like enzyme